ncbi:MAG TPA: glycosyltransferase, partial [Azospira sp.]|nr:glycosyltransferase [Azospira sp.]
MRTEFGQTMHPRIAIYSQDGLGLGHMRRTNSIAYQVLQARPDAGIITLSDSQLGQFFQTAQNHDYIKLPSIVKAGVGDWRAANLPFAFSDVLQLRTELIRGILVNYKPDLLLVDHMPHGAMGELIPALEALKYAHIPTQIVLGLRDILDAPEVIERRWAVEGAYQTIEQYYDRVLVYGMQDVYDMAQQYNFPTSIGNLLQYCGYVCTLQTVKNAAQIRKRALAGTRQGTRLIVAMAGGGADAYPMMKTVLEAYPKLRAHQDSSLILITGPFMPPEQLAALKKRARRLSARIMTSVDDTLSYIGAADLVIAMAGYNTTAEILRLNKPAILIPRVGPSAEQRTRARLFAARRWVEEIDPDYLTPERLTQSILTILSRPQEPGSDNRPDLQGVMVAANQLLSLLPPIAQNEERYS